MLDRTGNLIEKGQTVSVPSPNKTDMHNNSFSGYVEDVLESRGTIIVTDQCDEYFEIEPERVTIEYED